MIARPTRVHNYIVALAAASFIFAAAMPASQQTTLQPAKTAPLQVKVNSTPPTTPTQAPSATPPLRTTKDLALPGNINTLAPADIPDTNMGGLEKKFDSTEYRRAVKNGMALLRKEDWTNAALELQAALELNPQSKEVAYNLGIAKFRQGEFAMAEKLFKDSAETESSDLAAKSMFNEGNAIYANAVNNLDQPKPQSNPNATPVPGVPQTPTSDLEKWIEIRERDWRNFFCIS